MAEALRKITDHYLLSVCADRFAVSVNCRLFMTQVLNMIRLLVSIS